MSNNKTILKNSVFLAFRMVIVMVISLFTTRYLLANLGVEDYGIYNVTLGLVLMCTFLTPSLTNAIQRYYNFELGKSGEDGASKVFNMGLIVQLGMVAITILFCETIGLWYVKNFLVVPEGRETAAMWVYQIAVIAMSLSMLQVPFVASILAHERMNYYAIVNVIDAVLKLLIAIGIKYSDYDHLIVYGFLLLAIAVFDVLAYSLYSLSKFPETKIRLHVDRSLLLGMGAFTGWNLLETIARLIKDQGCNLLFNFFLGPVLNAARGVANQVTYAFTSIVESTIMASRPQMVQSYAKKDYDTSIKMFYTLSKGTLFLIYFLSLPVYIEIDYILSLWLGGNVPDYAPVLVRLSILVVLIDKLASPVTALIHATGKIKVYHIISSAMNIAVLPLSWAALYSGLDVTAVYIVTIIVTILQQMLYVLLLSRQINMPVEYYLKDVILKFLLILPSALIPYLIYLAMDSSFIRFLLTGISSVCSTTFLIYTKGMTPQERSLIKSIVKK